MKSLHAGQIDVLFDRNGDRHFKRSGVIDWIGKPVMIRFAGLVFHFDLEGRIHRIDGFESPYSWDWLQRTMANDWIYYDKIWRPGPIPEPSGLIGDTAWAINGRTDLPMLKGHSGLQEQHVARAFDRLDALIEIAGVYVERPPEIEPACAPEDAQRLRAFLAKVARHDRNALQRIADDLRTVHGGMPVLPPDTLNVDYQVLLIKVMDGCANACGFCTARSEAPFAIRSREDVDTQIETLSRIYGEDLYNYNAVVLGECDALVSPWVEYAARRAFETFQCGASYHAGSALFLFATNATLCALPDATIGMLDALPFEQVYVNVGWEAVTQDALDRLRKRLTREDVLAGMRRACDINATRAKVRISGNFICGEEYEVESVAEALRETQFRGQIYLSPLQNACGAAKALSDLRTLREASRAARVHLYTMQRL